MKFKRWHKEFFWWGGLLAVFLLISAWRAPDVPEGPAPLLSGTGLAGETLNLQAMQGKPVLVQFWASWCPICEFELGSVESLTEDYQVVTVALQSGEPHHVRQYLQEQGVEFPVINDPDGLAARQWGVKGVPATFIVGADGEVDFAESGFTSLWGLKARLWWSDCCAS